MSRDYRGLSGIGTSHSQVSFAPIIGSQQHAYSASATSSSHHATSPKSARTAKSHSARNSPADGRFDIPSAAARLGVSHSKALSSSTSKFDRSSSLPAAIKEKRRASNFQLTTAPIQLFSLDGNDVSYTTVREIPSSLDASFTGRQSPSANNAPKYKRDDTWPSDDVIDQIRPNFALHGMSQTQCDLLAKEIPIKFSVPASSTSITKGSYVAFPSDVIAVADSAACPGVPVVVKVPEERLTNPDRLNVDRRHLKVCPIVENEPTLRLFTMQHNLITEIQNLGHLRSLIFLDLYNNKITHISGLERLSGLRVLMLGNNEITRIDGLLGMPRLDVLDLHHNQISVIENIEHLSQLRVLNLATNSLTAVANVHRLVSLVEFNVRRNQIEVVEEIDELPRLERFFISGNNLPSFDSISCLTDCSCLLELALDDNPFTGDATYRHQTIERIRTLKTLDGRRINEEERRLAGLLGKKEEEKRRELERSERAKIEKILALKNAKRQWEKDHYRPSSAASTSTLHSSSQLMAGSSLYEVEGEMLRIVGEAMDVFDRNWPANITTLSVQFFDFDKFSALCGKLRTRLPNMTNLILVDNAISSLQQLHVLQTLKRIEKLTLENQPILKDPLLHLYVIYVLDGCSLQTFNNVDVTPSMRAAAKTSFGPFFEAIEREKPIHLVQPALVNGKPDLSTCTPYMDHLFATVSANIAQRNQLSEVWGSVLAEVRQEAANDVTDTSLVQARLQRMQASLI